MRKVDSCGNIYICTYNTATTTEHATVLANCQQKETCSLSVSLCHNTVNRKIEEGIQVTRWVNMMTSTQVLAMFLKTSCKVNWGFDVLSLRDVYPFLPDRQKREIINTVVHVKGYAVMNLSFLSLLASYHTNITLISGFKKQHDWTCWDTSAKIMVSTTLLPVLPFQFCYNKTMKKKKIYIYTPPVDF